MASGKKETDDGTTATKTLADFTRFGTYSIFFLVAYEIMLLPEAVNLLFMVYGGFAPRVVGCGQNDYRNMTTTEACAALDEARSQNKCIPQLETQFDSLAFEFGYYCDGMLMIKQSISLLIFAALLGSMLFGQLSDAFGRRRMLFIAHAGIFFFNLIASRTNSLTEFTTWQFGAMFFAGGHSAIMHVFLMENCAKRHRLWVSCLLNYSINYMLLSVISYWAADWRTLLRIASFLNIPAFCILMIAFESPRWLMQKHKIEKCRLVLRRIELINGTSTPERLNQLDGLIKREVELTETQSRKRHYYFYHLFHNLKTSIHVIVISYALVCTSIIAYSTMFNLEYLSGSVYLNTGLYGLFRYCINLSVGLLDYKYKKIGRKHIQNLFLISILIVLNIIIISKIIGLTNPFIVRLGILSAAGLGSQLYMLNAVVISELFPTAIRNVAASFITLFSRLGGVLAPYLFYLATYWDPLPFIIMAAFVFVNICLFNAFIPETKGRHLTDHLERKQRNFGLAASRPLIAKTTQNGTTKPTDPVKNAVEEFSSTIVAKMSTTDPNDNDIPDPITAKMVMNSDETKTENLGDHLRAGRYIIWFCFAYEAFLLPQMLTMTFPIYAGFSARVISCGSNDLHNLTAVEACDSLKSIQQTTDCKPQFEIQFESLAYEFGYYCSSISRVKQAISVLMAGVLVGAMLFGQLSDSFGRKRVMFFTHIGMLVFSLAASRASSLFEFTMLQTAAMVFVGGHNTVMHVFLIENLPKRLRVLVTCVISYSPNFVVQSMIAYYTGNWRMLLQVASLLNVVSLCFLLLTFESPRWQIQKGLLEDARMALTKIERINGTATEQRLRAIDRIIEHEIIQNEEKKRKRKYFFYHLFSTWKMCSYVAIISYALLSTSAASYGLLFNIESIPGSIFISTAIFGLFRWSANLLVGSVDFFLPKAGRKMIYNFAVSFILIMLLTVLITKISGNNNPMILRIATLSAAAMCSQLYIVNGVVTSELFPTPIRNVAVSFVQVSSRLGAITAPHIFLLQNLWEQAPYLLMFVGMALNQMIFNCLPETKGCPMPDQMPAKSRRTQRPQRTRRESLMTANIQPSSARLTEDI